MHTRVLIIVHDLYLRIEIHSRSCFIISMLELTPTR